MAFVVNPWASARLLQTTRWPGRTANRGRVFSWRTFHVPGLPGSGGRGTQSRVGYTVGGDHFSENGQFCSEGHLERVQSCAALGGRSSRAKYMLASSEPASQFQRMAARSACSLSEELITGKVLFVGAHPDDIEIGCGGTAAKCASRGDPVAFAIATREADGNKAVKRRREATKAAKLLELSEANGTLFFGELPDTRLDREKKQVREWLKDVRDSFAPDTVFFHRKDDHTDHQAIYTVSIGVFQTQNVLLYYIPRPFPETPFQPNYAVDISDFIKMKVAMCKCHASQEPDYVSPDSVLTNSHYFYQRSYGRNLWRKDGYAEGFHMFASRAPISHHSDPSLIYDLRLVKKAGGTFRWED